MHRSRTAHCLVAAAAVAALLGLVGTGAAATASKPKNQSPPTISGDAAVGSTISGHLGTWSGDPSDFNTWWRRCAANGGSCKNIDGTGGDMSYQVRARDAGHRIRFFVGAANSDGRTWALSAPTHVVPSTAPVNLSPPSLTGRPVVGATLAGSKGTWSSDPTDFNSWWQRCDANGNGCANIPGTAGQSHYRLRPADSGARMRYAVGAANAHGRTWAVSLPSAVIGGSAAPPSRNGCPGTSSPDDVNAIGPPARLRLDGLQAPSIVTAQTRTLVLRFHVSSTCGGSVRGALVYVTATPFFQFAVPPEQPTDADGWAEVHMQRLAGFPVSSRQQLIALYARARKPGESPLAGISIARLFSVRVNLHA